PATVAGSKPSGIPNAPALPDLSKFSAANYPEGDHPPDTNSPEVAQWVKDVQASGVVIPDFKLHVVDGSEDCKKPENVPRIGNETECWWTCGKCVRKTDIVDCKTQGNWGSSFDDGPSDYTNELLQYLEQQKLRTTFFVVGSRVALRPQSVQTQYMLGHQIGVHTWSHRPLTTQSTIQVIAELGWSKKIVTDVLGVTPLYFRPPDGDIDDRVRAIARAMNLTPVLWTSVKDSNNQDFPFDSFDYLVAQGDVSAADSTTKFQGLIDAVKKYDRGSIVLEHDIVWQEVKLAVGYFLPAAQKAGFKIMPVNQCMAHNLADTYAETTSLKGVPEGSGLGNAVTGAGQKASPDAPLGGSDTTNNGG
ncbi:glycoside hydrolase/deacetylase, partial [Auriculariales sp. MPI-PUGE-AT-0066]